MTNRIKVLVVDDKKVIGDFFDFTLGYFGHDITVVHDPREALKVAQEKEFDIAFLDMMMPKIGGIDFLKKLQENSEMYKCPVLVSSNLSSVKKVSECLALGAVGYVIKSDESMASIVQDIERILNVDKK